MKSNNNVDTQLMVSAQAVLKDRNSPSEEYEKALETISKIRSPQVGTRVLVRTCTIYSTGMLVEINPEWIVLAEVTSVLETGETKPSLLTGKWKTSEVHPENSLLWIDRGAVVDVAVVGG